MAYQKNTNRSRPFMQRVREAALCGATLCGDLGVTNSLTRNYPPGAPTKRRPDQPVAGVRRGGAEKDEPPEQRAFHRSRSKKGASVERVENGPNGTKKKVIKKIRVKVVESHRDQYYIEGRDGTIRPISDQQVAKLVKKKKKRSTSRSARGTSDDNLAATGKSSLSMKKKKKKSTKKAKALIFADEKETAAAASDVAVAAKGATATAKDEKQPAKDAAAAAADKEATVAAASAKDGGNSGAPAEAAAATDDDKKADESHDQAVPADTVSSAVPKSEEAPHMDAATEEVKEGTDPVAAPADSTDTDATKQEAADDRSATPGAAAADPQPANAEAAEQEDAKKELLLNLTVEASDSLDLTPAESSHDSPAVDEADVEFENTATTSPGRICRVSGYLPPLNKHLPPIIPKDMTKSTVDQETGEVATDRKAEAGSSGDFSGGEKEDHAKKGNDGTAADNVSNTAAGTTEGGQKQEAKGINNNATAEGASATAEGSTDIQENANSDTAAKTVGKAAAETGAKNAPVVAENAAVNENINNSNNNVSPDTGDNEPAEKRQLPNWLKSERKDTPRVGYEHASAYEPGGYSDALKYMYDPNFAQMVDQANHSKLMYEQFKNENLGVKGKHCKYGSGVRAAIAEGRLSSMNDACRRRGDGGDSFSSSPNLFPDTYKTPKRDGLQLNKLTFQDMLMADKDFITGVSEAVDWLSVPSGSKLLRGGAGKRALQSMREADEEFIKPIHNALSKSNARKD